MLGEKYMRRHAIKDIAAAINEFDRMTAAKSYGRGHSHLERVIALLPWEDRQTLAEMANRFALQRLEKAHEKLCSFNIDPGSNPRPEEYRLNDKRYYDTDTSRLLHDEHAEEVNQTHGKDK